MRKLLNTSILVFAFCFCAFGQIDNIVSCPTVSVTGPSGISSLNELINYSASIDLKGKDIVPEYVWSVSKGKIVEGQGTQNIKIELQPSDGGLTAAVEVKGFPEGCQNIASETMTIDPAPEPVKIDVFSEPFVKTNKNRINEIVRTLENDPNARLYIIFRHKENTSQKGARRKEMKVFNSLIEYGVEKDRITMINDFGQSESIEFWLVPAGATPPTIKDN